MGTQCLDCSRLPFTAAPVCLGHAAPGQFGILGSSVITHSGDVEGQPLFIGTTAC